MQVVVLADEADREEFKAKKTSADIQIIFIETVSEVLKYPFGDAFFLLKEDINKEDYTLFGDKPAFINATINTLKELDLPDNISRINGWPTFLNREIWEIASAKEGGVKEIFEKLDWKYIKVADEPGLVSARIISMIINEAYFALGEDASSKDEIDMAMKLGTNYPYGPFEWSSLIGLKRVYNLLERLGKTDTRYNIAPAMKNDLLNL